MLFILNHKLMQLAIDLLTCMDGSTFKLMERSQKVSTKFISSNNKRQDIQQKKKNQNKTKAVNSFTTRPFNMANK